MATTQDAGNWGPKNEQVKAAQLGMTGACFSEQPTRWLSVRKLESCLLDEEQPEP